MVVVSDPFEDFKVLEEYMKERPPIEPIGIKVLMEDGEIIKLLGLYYYERRL